ncbi:phosphate acyltransferase [Gallalistipes aquisgranensis]|uniref:phosphate acyltransferase n=1 Tax=Gallalistipes aquisgranensis TaxID=2779358 RepID=UPI001CF843AB|nr:phosphate acyltransferase [Gallalistipes aquisgranensis]MBE5033365.1 phosphate butyryltransferase [Gallalistipes aquisgranensis]
MIRELKDIVETVRSRGRKRLVVAYAQDAHTLESVSEAVDMGIAEATLLGDPAEIERVCRQEGIDPGKFTVISESSDVKCVQKAVRMVSEGEGDVLMKGLVSTDKYMRGILNKEFGLVPPKGVLSHVAVLQLPQYHKLLTVTDVAVIPYPDLGQKQKLVRYLTETARSLGVERPKIACIAPSEQLLPNVTSSVEAALIAKMGDRGQFGDVVIDGPLALDVALFREVAEVKKLKGSLVAGDPDCLLFPNIDSANVFFKSATKLCGAELAGMVVGTKVPCVLTSRGDTKTSKLYSIALACLSARQERSDR